MRTNLEKHIGSYVLCRGWIGGWEDMPDCSTRRLYIKQPTIKIANPELIFEEQEKISTEHHINLFVNHSDLQDYESNFEIHTLIDFAGFIEKYTRANGTTDYGIYPAKQSTLDFRLGRLVKSIDETLRNQFSEEDLSYLSSALNQVRVLREELDASGVLLPTFKQTKEEFLWCLDALLLGLTKSIRRTKGMLSSREYRRSQRTKKTPLEEAGDLKERQKASSLRKKELRNAFKDL
jgi:hypothetical protein